MTNFRAAALLAPLLLAVGCTFSPAAGTAGKDAGGLVDGTPPDAAPFDAGHPDAAERDASPRPDAARDGALPEVGIDAELDAGDPDADLDAGLPPDADLDASVLDGTVADAECLSPSSAVNQSFDADQNARAILFGTDDSLAPSGAFTIELWLFIRDENRDDMTVLERVLPSVGTPTEGWQLRFERDSTDLELRVRFYGGGQSFGMGPAALGDRNSWIHVAVAGHANPNGTDAKLFIDGEQVDSMNTSQVIGPALGAMFRMPPHLGTNRTRSRLDDLRLSDVVRYTNAYTPAVAPAPDENTLGQWRMNELDTALLVVDDVCRNHGLLVSPAFNGSVPP